MELIASGGSKKVKIFRWTARVIFLIFFLLAMFIFIGGAINDDHSSPDPGIGIFVFFFTIAMTSMLVSWKYEKLGGILSLVGSFGMSFAIFVTAGTNQLLAATLIPSPFYLVSILFILAGVFGDRD